MSSDETKTIETLIWEQAPLEDIKAARTEGRDWLNEGSDPEILCRWAANYGRADLLEWLRENEMPWDTIVTSGAADCGHVKVLEWAYNNGCPIDQSAWMFALWKNHVDVLQWIHDLEVPLEPYGTHYDHQHNVCIEALSANKPDILKWAIKNGYSWNEYTCAHVIKDQPSSRRGRVFSLALEHGCPFDKDECLSIARHFQDNNVAKLIECV